MIFAVRLATMNIVCAVRSRMKLNTTRKVSWIRREGGAHVGTALDVAKKVKLLSLVTTVRTGTFCEEVSHSFLYIITKWKDVYHLAIYGAKFCRFSGGEWGGVVGWVKQTSHIRAEGWWDEVHADSG